MSVSVHGRQHGLEALTAFAHGTDVGAAEMGRHNRRARIRCPRQHLTAGAAGQFRIFAKDTVPVRVKDLRRVVQDIRNENSLFAA